MATAVLIGTLDTKGVEYTYVKDCVGRFGVDVLMIDVGVLNDPAVKCDIGAREVAKAAGRSLDDLRFAREGSDTRAIAISCMSEGATAILHRLIAEGRCDAVFGMGGSGGTNLLSAMMKTLPLGLPKLIVSTMMSGDVRPYVGGSDLMMMHSVTDIAGLNRFSRQILANAACAVAGMAKKNELMGGADGGSKKPLVGISMFGITTPGVLRIRQKLEENGFDTIVFHATGSGGMAMEAMIADGHINGVIEYTLAELCAHEFGGVFDASADRLTAAPKAGIPQVIVPGAIEVLNFGPVETLPAHLNTPERKLIVHNPTVCAVKATHGELAALGRILAEKVNASKGLVHVLLPTGGLDAYEAPGGPWVDPEGDEALFGAIEGSLNEGIPCERLGGNVNDAQFADAVSQKFLDIWGKDAPRRGGVTNE